MENNLENLTIGVFARTAGVNVETIRFYQRKGLLPEPDKPYGSIRRYGETDGHCCKVSDEAAFCLIQRPYISKTL
ncbi:MerR family DNA-binding transcriptional regulator, partial [Enterobacter hormaechei]|uniref:MerR family DNA-binding transcriptional regulator n=1 Tax=Enterobacter hormaechei TaxID=158836 RepID=UPI001F564346